MILPRPKALQKSEKSSSAEFGTRSLSASGSLLMEASSAVLWEDFGILALYMVFALGTMYLITGPPLERWLHRRKPDISPDDLQRRRDRLMFLWAIVNLIILIYWFAKYRSIGPV